MSTHNVCWPNEQANSPKGPVEVTIIAWDYEAKRGTAMATGGQIVEVAQVTTLTIVERQSEEQH